MFFTGILPGALNCTLACNLSHGDISMARTRERFIGPKYGDFTRTLDYAPFGSIDDTANYSVELRYKHENMQDQLTPGFTIKAKKGEILPVNPMYQLVTDRTYTPGNLYYTDDSTLIRDGVLLPFAEFQHHQYVPVEYIDLPNITDEYSRLSKLAMSYAKAADFDVLTFLFELNKTVDLFVDAAKRWREAVLRLARWAKKKSKGKGYKKWKTPYEIFTQGWLEGRYGWRIAYYDALGLLSVMNDKINKYSRGFATEEIESEHWASIDYNYSQFSGQANLNLKVKHTIRAGAFYVVDVSRPNVIKAPFNPVVTTWELLPYSFVWDWFLDVGKTLTAITPRAGYSLNHMWISHKIEVTGDKINGYINFNSPWNGIVEWPTIDYKYRQYSRFPWYDYQSLPSFDLNFDAFKLIDLIALFVGNRNAVVKILSD